MNIGKKVEYEKPEYSYIAELLVNAFNTIARARRYESGVPLTISPRDIRDYLELNECPIDIDIFQDAVFMLDNIYIDEAYSKIKKPSN